ncbi:hypothetical protein HpHA286_16030 [Helicobacter pylori]
MFAYYLLQKFKKCLEHAILQEGEKGFSNIIRSQKPINYIHEMIKQDLVKNGIVKENIFPPLGSSKPKIKLAGFLSKKTKIFALYQIIWIKIKFSSIRDH